MAKPKNVRTEIVKRSPIVRIARDFKALADRFEQFGSRDVKLSHLAKNTFETKVRAGRLLIEAIDAGAFPKSDKKVNGDWWDRSCGRVPGLNFTVMNSMQWTAGEPYPWEQQEYLDRVTGAWSQEQYSMCWTHAITSWMQKAFPSRFRHNAAACDWKHIATDAQGHPLDQQGKPLVGRWYKNGKMLPKSFKWERKLGPGYNWKIVGEFTHIEDSYDEADWLAHQRVRAEVYADACRLLSEMVNPAAVQNAHASSTEPDLTIITEEKLKLIIRQQLKAETKTCLTDDIFLAAYRQHGSVRKAAAYLSEETQQSVSKDRVYNAVNRAGGVRAVLRAESSESIQRNVASQRRDRQMRFASPMKPPEMK